MGETSWSFLIVGTFAAAGAAMAVGTLAALVRHRRTGRFPGEEAASAADAVPRSRLLALWLRVALGTAVAVLGLLAMAQAGLL